RATGGSTVAIGENAQATAFNSIAIGPNSVANEANTVAVSGPTTPDGRRITGVAKGINAHDAVNVQQLNAALAAGYSAEDIYGDIVMGTGASAWTASNINGGHDGERNIAIGHGAYADTGSVSIGQEAKAGRHGIAIGQNASAGGLNGWGGIAIGDDAKATSTAFNGQSIAIGNGSTTFSDGSGLGVGGRVAIDGIADGDWSIAIGGNTHGRAYTASFGDRSEGLTRHRTGVGADSAATDAVNVRQLMDGVATVDGGGASNPYGAAQGTGVAGEDAEASGVNRTASGASASATAYGTTATGAMA